MWSPGPVRGGDSAIPQQHDAERRTDRGGTSCPQAAKEAKLCQVAAHPAADAKYSSVFFCQPLVQTVDYYRRNARHGPRDPFERMKKEF